MNISKRPETGSDCYYVRFQFKGKRYLRSTGKTAMAAARVKAKEIVAAVKGGDAAKAEALKIKSGCPTVAAVQERYRARVCAVSDIRERTARDNAAALEKIFSTVRGEGVKLDGVRASEITAALLKEFKEKRLAAAGRDWAARESAKITANSILRAAASVFTRDALDIYEGMGLPKITAFKDVGRFEVEKDVRFKPVPQELLERMDAAAREGLPATDPLAVEDAAMRVALRESDPAAYLGYLLAIRLGMRASEIVAARWEWVERGDGGAARMAIITRPDFKPKGAEGRVPIAAGVLAELEALGGERDDGTGASGRGHILPAANPTERDNAVRRRLSAFVRRFLPDREKSCHELRKIAGSLVLTRTRSMAHTQRFLRHKSIATTERYYATLLDELAPLESVDWRSGLTAA